MLLAGEAERLTGRILHQGKPGRKPAEGKLIGIMYPEFYTELSTSHLPFYYVSI